MPDGPIVLPRDQYVHKGAPKEWWWHTGTLRAADRVFGFEINAVGVTDEGRFQYVEAMVTDVQNQVHYQATNGQEWHDDWAESDPGKPWDVRMDDPKGAWSVQMTSDLATPFTMNVSANFQALNTNCRIGLSLTQSSPPLLVWGTGVHVVDKNAPTPITQNNYYYSFTKLQARGIVAIGTTTYPVEGVTWMDHEYGAFLTSTTWILQDAQLSNGYHLSNYVKDTAVVEGQRMASNATILLPEGDSLFVDTFVTPLAPVWIDPQGVPFCLTMLVEIPTFNATLTVESLMPGQQFGNGGAASVYEGVATVRGTFGGEDVTGTGWIEQLLVAP